MTFCHLNNEEENGRVVFMLMLLRSNGQQTSRSRSGRGGDNRRELSTGTVRRGAGGCGCRAAGSNPLLELRSRLAGAVHATTTTHWCGTATTSRLNRSERGSRRGRARRHVAVVDWLLTRTLGGARSTPTPDTNSVLSTRSASAQRRASPSSTACPACSPHPDTLHNTYYAK